MLYNGTALPGKLFSENSRGFFWLSLGLHMTNICKSTQNTLIQKKEQQMDMLLQNTNFLLKQG